MPLVRIKRFKERDNITKVKIMELMTEAIFESCGCSHDAVTVIIEDVDRASWRQGGKPFA